MIVGARFIESPRLRWRLDLEEAGYLVSPVGRIARVPQLRCGKTWIARSPATFGKSR
jgi:hypothetical protein